MDELNPKNLESFDKIETVDLQVEMARSYPSGKKETEIAAISLGCGYSRTLSVWVRVPSGSGAYP